MLFYFFHYCWTQWHGLGVENPGCPKAYLRCSKREQLPGQTQVLGLTFLLSFKFIYVLPTGFSFVTYYIREQSKTDSFGVGVWYGLITKAVFKSGIFRWLCSRTLSSLACNSGCYIIFHVNSLMRPPAMSLQTVWKPVKATHVICDTSETTSWMSQ